MKSWKVVHDLNTSKSILGGKEVNTGWQRVYNFQWTGIFFPIKKRKLHKYYMKFKNKKSLWLLKQSSQQYRNYLCYFQWTGLWTVYNEKIRESCVPSKFFVLKCVPSSLNQDWVRDNWNLWFLFLQHKIHKSRWRPRVSAKALSKVKAMEQIHHSFIRKVSPEWFPGDPDPNMSTSIYFV